jgi:hypothetical protein
MYIGMTIDNIQSTKRIFVFIVYYLENILT